MNPVPPIVHIAALVVGIWLGLEVMGKIYVPADSVAAAEAEREAVLLSIEEAEAERERERAELERERVETCLAGAAAVSEELPAPALRAMRRSCEDAPALSPRGVCVRAVAEGVNPGGPVWARSNAACLELPGN